ncbi:MAG: cyanophycinase [Planctomycetota bacterium]
MSLMVKGAEEADANATPQTGSVPIKGSLVIIGGSARHDHQEIWHELLRLAGGSRPRIAVFPCASNYPLKYGQRAVELLERHGADAFLVPLAPTGIEGSDPQQVARDPEIIERVRGSRGVFFIGGSQNRIRESLLSADRKPSPLLDAIWDLYRRGGVISGTSAGAAIMSQVMFREPGSVLNTMLNGVAMGKEIDHGLGFLNNGWFVDQHCLVRGRFARALVAMQQQKLNFGIGIDEDSALVVEQGVTARVIGQRGAVMLDLSQATHDDSIASFNVKNARLSYLNNGDQLNLTTHEVSPSPAKLSERKIDPNSPEFRPFTGRRLFYTDILANTALHDVLTRVIEHRDGNAIGLAFDGVKALDGQTSGFEFKFYRDKDSLGWESETNGTTDCTIKNIHLDVRPVVIHGPLYGDAVSSPRPSGN